MTCAASIEILVQKLMNAIKEQLHRTLLMIQAYLNNAQKKYLNKTQEAVNLWLRDLEAVAFDANNILDEIMFHLLHQKLISRPKKLAPRIKQINMAFDSMNQRQPELAFKA